MVKEAQESKSRTQDLTNRAAKWLFYLALVAGFITLFAWLALGYSFDIAIERMVTVMVITCPHALGLAAPLVVAVSTSISAKQGLLIRNRADFEGARNLNAVVFDKTGTLTKGSLGSPTLSRVTAIAKNKSCSSPQRSSRTRNTRLRRESSNRQKRATWRSAKSLISNRLRVKAYKAKWTA